MSFEDSMKRLEELSDLIRDEETSLDDAIRYYEEGMSCYKACSDIIDEAKQKIEVFDRNKSAE